MEDTQVELPKYQCHNLVWAAKIMGIEPTRDGSEHATVLILENQDGKRFAEQKVSDHYMTKHQPVVGGYYVVYEDGYQSFSPGSAFESGYSKLFFW